MTLLRCIIFVGVLAECAWLNCETQEWDGPAFESAGREWEHHTGHGWPAVVVEKTQWMGSPATWPYTMRGVEPPDFVPTPFGSSRNSTSVPFAIINLCTALCLAFLAVGFLDWLTNERSRPDPQGEA